MRPRVRSANRADGTNEFEQAAELNRAQLQGPQNRAGRNAGATQSENPSSAAAPAMAGWSANARAALREAGLSRRRFLQGAGLLLIGFSLRGFAPDAAAQGQFEGGEVGPAHDLVDSWLAIGTDGTVTAYTGKSELGQGISTAQTQLVAEELCVPFERVKMIFCDT